MGELTAEGWFQPAKCLAKELRLKVARKVLTVQHEVGSGRAGHWDFDLVCL